MRWIVALGVFAFVVLGVSGLRLGGGGGGGSSSSGKGKGYSSKVKYDRHEMPPSEGPIESYTAGYNDYSVDSVRTAENMAKRENEMEGSEKKPYMVHDLFQNGVDMSAHVARTLERNEAATLNNPGKVDDGLMYGTTFGEEPEAHASREFPDELMQPNNWNPIPPNFHPRFPAGLGLDANVFDSVTPVASGSQPAEEDPDGLGGEKGTIGVATQKAYKVFRDVVGSDLTHQATLPPSAAH